jgi:hypothetical protein
MQKSRSIVVVVALASLASEGWAGTSPVIFFQDNVSFTQYMNQQSKTLKGIEDFEYAQMSGGKTPFPDPLDSVTPSVPFPNGLLSPNLRIQTNRNPGPFAAPDAPSGNSQALYVVAPGAFGSNSFKVGEDLGILAQIHCSMDLIFTSNDKTGIGFDLSRFTGFGTDGWIIGVFDVNNVLIGQTAIPGPVPTNPSKNFVGMWSPVPIGRVNIYDPNLTSPDAVDNIQMWTIPAPGAASLLLVAGLVGGRRRR